MNSDNTIINMRLDGHGIHLSNMDARLYAAEAKIEELKAGKFFAAVETVASDFRKPSPLEGTMRVEQAEATARNAPPAADRLTEEERRWVCELSEYAHSLRSIDPVIEIIDRLAPAPPQPKPTAPQEDDEWLRDHARLHGNQNGWKTGTGLGDAHVEEMYDFARTEVASALARQSAQHEIDVVKARISAMQFGMNQTAALCDDLVCEEINNLTDQLAQLEKEQSP